MFGSAAKLFWGSAICAGIALAVTLSATREANPDPTLGGGGNISSASAIISVSETPASSAQLPSGLRTHGILSGGAQIGAAFHKINPGQPPQIFAQAALLADLESGTPYFALNPGRRWPMASITKLMTAVYAREQLGLDSKVTLGSGDFPEPNATGPLTAGDAYTVRDLLSSLLLLSRNEAADALANIFGRANFIAGLNNLAASWGLMETNFGDPSGLSPENQSTPWDLHKMAREIFRTYKDIFDMTAKKTAVITELKSGRSREISNINLLTGVRGFLGGKTGYTDEAGGNLLTLFSHGGRPVFMVVMGSEDRFGETEKLMAWFKRNFGVND